MREPWRTFGALVALSLLLLGGCTKPNESERYLSAITVDGYRKVGDGYDAAPLAYFVGPATEDINASVHGPGDLRVAKDNINLSNGLTHHLGSGEGTLDGNVTCQVLVFRIQPGGSTVPYVGKGKLTDNEAAGVLDGTLHVLRVSALCEPQADR